MISFTRKLPIIIILKFSLKNKFEKSKIKREECYEILNKRGKLMNLVKFS